MQQSLKMTRRRALTGLGAAAAASLTGCAAVPAAVRLDRYSRPLSRRPFVAPRISMDRIVRVVVGLRPYRRSGFVVRRERLDDKEIVHNYGHGGGGLSLSWGSSALAVREAQSLPAGDAAVLGSGVMGLTTARLLQDAGWRVTIYTRDTLRHSTSSVGAGQWAPTSVFEEAFATPAFEAQFQAAARIAHHAYQNLVGADYGVRFIENYYLNRRSTEPPYYLRVMPELFTSVADLDTDQHPFPAPYVRRAVSLFIEPARFLRRIRDDFLLAGGRMVIRNFENLAAVLGLEEGVIFNCTGLGSKALFADDELTPIKGQLVFIPPDPAVDYLTVGGGSGNTYMFPRVGEIVLGGSYQKGDWSRNPEPEVTERIVGDNRRLFDNLRI
ncbi:MAG: FAD-dependent oxidoreductase [Pseudomonadales bacterium]|nr:FAD-binding oxidoreductase [Pseudomonadales bacterium]